MAVAHSRAMNSKGAEYLELWSRFGSLPGAGPGMTFAATARNGGVASHCHRRGRLGMLPQDRWPFSDDARLSAATHYGCRIEFGPGERQQFLGFDHRLAVHPSDSERPCLDGSAGNGKEKTRYQLSRSTPVEARGQVWRAKVC